MKELDFFTGTLAYLPKDFNVDGQFELEILRFTNSMFYCACVNEAQAIVVYKNELFFQKETLVPIVKLSELEVQLLKFKIKEMAKIVKEETQGRIDNFKLANKLINVQVTVTDSVINLELSPAIQ